MQHIFQTISRRFEMEQSKLVETVKLYIEVHYKEESLNITSIAYKLRRNPKYLARVFRKEMGEGILDYIHQIRIRQAVLLFHAGQYSVKEVGTRVGYATYRSFCRAFTKNIGVTPREYMGK